MIFRNRSLMAAPGFLLVSLLITSLVPDAAASQNNSHNNDQQQTVPGSLSGKVTETINTAGYTYAEVDTGSEKVWAAAPTTSLKIGDRISFTTGMPMKNFHSNSMQRDFPVLYFVDGFITGEQNLASTAMPSASAHAQIPKATVIETIEGINKLENGNTIAEVYSGKQQLSGKTVRVRGKVTRVTLNVMGKNWIHIRDSSTLDDLTITTDDTAAIGDLVIIEGPLSLDKDFGYGYVYPLIVEDAKLSKQ